jgi:Rrf2 family protein
VLGAGEPLIGRFLIYDALRMRFRELKLRKDADCPVCGTHPTVKKLIDYEQFCGVAPHQLAAAAAPVTNADALTSRELKSELDRGDEVVIVDVREPQEYQINRLPGSILIPLGDLPKRYVELDPNANIVTQCKSGMRSAKAQDFLRSKGFTACQEPDRRRARLDRPGRPQPTEVLGGLTPFRFPVYLERGQTPTSSATRTVRFWANIGLRRSYIRKRPNMLRLSKKSDYALISMKHLALRPDASSSAREISESYDIPLELLAKVLQRLVRARLLVSVQGTRGGYRLGRSASLISVADVIQAVDGPVTVTACSEDDHNCDQFTKCSIRDPALEDQEPHPGRADDGERGGDGCGSGRAAAGARHTTVSRMVFVPPIGEN